MEYPLHVIGFIQSCFKEKFATPRQAQLAPAATGKLELIKPFDSPELTRGLEQVSHIWLTFIFHQSPLWSESSRLNVRPPRLGGNKSIGIFASRSPHRPNRLGQSIAKLEKIQANTLFLSGIDLIEGTPIVDIKPYVPYADCILTAHNFIAPSAPEQLTVHWSKKAEIQAKIHEQRLGESITLLINQCLVQDPKPAYQKHLPERHYGTHIWDLNIRWHYPKEKEICILSIELFE
ncbi:UNVERIFIED_CONTAM: hypothetical protein GTU68_010982 [Idotea baltica]|nr:hypothetical protein [Idotea baltica]